METLAQYLEKNFVASVLHKQHGSINPDLLNTKIARKEGDLREDFL